MAEKTRFDRVAFSPREFAELFGKSQTWGYRQIYAAKVKTITAHGRTLIPAAEVDSILKAAGIYDGLKRKRPKSKTEIQQLAPQLKATWRDFLAARRGRVQTPPKTPAKVVKWPTAVAGRDAALRRLTGAKGKVD